MKKLIFVALCLVMACSMLAVLTSCDDSSIQEDWSTIIIGDKLPTPQKGKLESGSNLDDFFAGGIKKVDHDYYVEYKNACIDMGYTVESKEQGDRYEAFNSNGYDLSLHFYNDRISITFSAPEELSELTWPLAGIGSMLPATVSNLGKVLTDSSDCFKVVIGNTTLENFNEYVNFCKQFGFNMDYISDEDSYYSKNPDGYRLNIDYVGCNRIEVMIQTPKEDINTITDASKETNNTTIQTDPPVTDAPSADGLSEDFKTAMDSYEAFFDEYVDFMKKYKESNGTDLSLLLDYSNYVSKYAETLADFEKWENCELSNEELAYYMQVQNRITQKLLEVAE